MLASGNQLLLAESPVVELPHNYPVEPTPEQILKTYSDLYGVDNELAFEIIRCESSWIRTAKNPNSSASGYWQFIDRTWLDTMRRMGLPETTRKDDPVVSIQAGVWLLATDGTRHWRESQYCWDK